MKLHYFYQPVADQDDPKLAAAIADGVVPATCLLGGEVIAVFRHVNRKPCDGCQAPPATRARCGGTEQVDETMSHDPKAMERLDRLLGDKGVADFYRIMEKKDDQ